MEYRVKITNYAIEQINNCVKYISKLLNTTETAKLWLKRVKNSLESLDVFPQRMPLVDIEPWHSKEIHKMFIENFIAYFWIDEEKKIVWITAFVYGKREQTVALKNMSYENEIKT